MATDPARITTPERTAEDADAALRPKTLDEFIGQQAARENLRVFVHAAKARGEPLDHVLLHGPPGLGKTTLAGILAREMGVGFRATSGPVIAKSGDLAALLTNLEDGDVLFIDEIHRLNPAVEEVLYPAMEDRALDLMIGGRLLRRVRDFAHAAAADSMTQDVADKALSRLEIDALGLDAMDRRYLTMIADLYGGGPVGVETLAAGLSEPRDTIEDVIEPFLIQLGLIARTARGRALNSRGYAHLGLPVPQGSQSGLFDEGAASK